MDKWNYSKQLTEEESNMVSTFLGQHKNYTFQPVAIATRCQQETYYRFLCIASPKDNNLSTHFVLITMTQSNNQHVQVNNIYPIDLFLN